MAELLQQMVNSAEKAATAMAEHMASEEALLIAQLERHLPAPAQCAMVWSMLRSMPLRLLERVMPWVFGARERLGRTDSTRHELVAASL